MKNRICVLQSTCMLMDRGHFGAYGAASSPHLKKLGACVRVVNERKKPSFLRWIIQLIQHLYFIPVTTMIRVVIVSTVSWYERKNLSHQRQPAGVQTKGWITLENLSPAALSGDSWDSTSFPLSNGLLSPPEKSEWGNGQKGSGTPTWHIGYVSGSPRCTSDPRISNNNNTLKS